MSDIDKRTGSLVSGGADWEELRSFLIAEIPTALTGYEQALDTAPPELASDIKALRDFTALSVTLAEDSNSIFDWASKIEAQPNATEVATAGERLNAFATGNCGFSIN